MAAVLFPRLGSDVSKGFRRLRKGHWSTQGLLCLCAGIDGRLYSLFPQTFPGGSGTSGGQGNGGMGLQFNQPMTPLQGNQFPTTGGTALLVMTHYAAAGGGFSAFGTDDSSRFGAHVPWSDNHVYFEWAGQEIDGGIPGYLGRHAWAFTAGPSGFGMFKDAVRISGSGTAANTRTNGSASMQINGGQGTGGYSSGPSFEFFAILSRTWSPAMVMEWSQNPWLMFENTPLVSTPAGGVVGSGALSPFLVGCTT